MSVRAYYTAFGLGVIRLITINKYYGYQPDNVFIRFGWGFLRQQKTS